MQTNDARKTYKSSKDLGSALDPRELINNNDDKNSLFDAFYIKHIKQTKRELSSVGSFNRYRTAGKKVRKKRKVVKADIEGIPEVVSNLTYSTHLTPDKSIHVNKAPDLFDLLLNSSSPKDLLPKKTENKVFENLQPRNSKAYKRSLKTFKGRRHINQSSLDSSDSDKENCNSNNMTDIQQYNFIIEKASKPCNDSINNISNDLLLIKNNFARNDTLNLNGSHSKSPSDSFKLKEHNKTAKSPLCSTPFITKYRGKSIFKLSPIAINQLDDNEDSINKYVSDDNFKLPENENVSNFVPTSPILHYSQKCKSQDNHLSTKNDSEFGLCHNDLPNDIVAANSTNTISNSTDNNPSINIKYLTNNKSRIYKSIKQNNSSVNNTVSSPVITPKCSSNCKSKFDSITNNCKFDPLSSENPSSIQLSGDYEPFVGFTNSEIAKEEEVLIINDTCDANKIEGRNVDTSIQHNESEDNTRKFNSKSDEDRDLNRFEKSDSSIYDTCHESDYYSSDNNQSTDDIESNKLIKEPFIAVQKLSDSLSRYYLNKIPANSLLSLSPTENIESADSSDDESSNRSTNNKFDMVEKECSISDTSDSSNTGTDDAIDNTGSRVVLTGNYESADDYVNESANMQQKVCTSYVTRRRKADAINDTVIMMLNSSDSSSNTDSECNDRTIITADELKSVQYEDTKKIDTETYSTDQQQQTQHKDKASCNVEIPSVPVRKSDKLSKCNIPNVSSELKQGIVLQPGKKWERSLSIYRRMSVMNESNISILDDEDLLKKGRKYRESVINTMEMQEKGPLHDESFRNRRQTIVSKSFRNTIRIVKETADLRISLNATSVYDDLTGFLNEDCDDTVVELSKLSITDVGHEATIIEKFHDTSERVSSARDYVLRRCNQTEAILFDECYPDTVLKNCHKIGEGVYGEVFLWRGWDGRARVMKIIPVAGCIKVNGENQKDYQEIISEIVIAMELSALRAPIPQIESHFEEGNEAETLDLHTIENATDIFNEVLAVRCVYGNYPSRLLDLWDLYDESKGSENDNPAILPPDQQFIVLELSNAGQDLESYQFNNAEQAYALFLQVAYGLAVGEESYQFEHRDLHWGNVLIAPTEQKYATFVLRGRSYRVLRRGVAATIIDYSLSRLSLPLATGERVSLYNELSNDEELFNAVGDYQFQVYRLMRDKLSNEWKNFEPYTNILWLHYMVDKMITALRYKRTNTKLHKHYIAKLKGIKNRILDYGSTVQFVLTDNEF